MQGELQQAGVQICQCGVLGLVDGWHSGNLQVS